MAQLKLLLLGVTALIVGSEASVGYNPFFYPGITTGYQGLIGYQVPHSCPITYCTSPYNNQYYCCNQQLNQQAYSYNPTHHPGINQQFSSNIYSYPPPQCLRTFCKSPINNSYYCCTTFQQQQQQQLTGGTRGIYVNNPYYNPYGKK